MLRGWSANELGWLLAPGWLLVLGCQAEFARLAAEHEGSVVSAAGGARAERPLLETEGSERNGSSERQLDGGEPTRSVSPLAPSRASAEVGAAREVAAAPAAAPAMSPAPACDNGVRDGNESDRDCGGDCAPCRDGLACRVGGDCQSRVCGEGVCAEATCDDQQVNGDETDRDCGGQCAACANGAGCQRDVDCASGYCIDGACRDVECVDEQRNGSETDVDCGGPLCAACPQGRRCEQPSDCLSLVCAQTPTVPGLRCQLARCDDAVQNGSETDIDCAGECEPCAEGMACDAASDCQSRICDDGRCAAASCDDQQLNGGESDVDCGGQQCALCAAEQRCAGDADCLSARCVSGRCQPGGFDDGCRSPDDCVSGVCEAGRCVAGEPGVPCREAADCYSHRCDSTCLPGDLRVRSNSMITSGPDDGTIEIGLFVEAGPTTYEWSELALLYFFDPDGAEQLRRLSYDNSDGHEPVAYCADVGASQWVYVHRTAYAGVVAGEVAVLERIANDPWSGFLDTNDYSYLSQEGVNPKVVVCRRRGERWGLLQGTAPEDIPDACDYAGGCEAARRCRVLQSAVENGD